MSETDYYTGTIKKVEKKPGETKKELMTRLLKESNINYDPDCIEDDFYDTFYESHVAYGENIYEILEKNKKDAYEDIFEATEIDDDKISFTVKYYNGGCSFGEAIEESLEKLNGE